MPGMTYLHDLFEYNRWANELVLAATDQLSPEALAVEMPNLGGSALGLLEHTSRVEAAFLGLMTRLGEPRPRPEGYAAVRALFASNSDGFQEALPALEARLQEQLEVPWFERSFTIEQLLTQVATHSVQHRAGICAGIALAGGTAPGLDYIMWLNENR